MNRDELIGRLLAATPEQLEAVATVFNNGGNNPRDTRLLSMGETCKALNLSRSTLWRILGKGALPTIALPDGGRRVPAWAVAEFAKTGRVTLPSEKKSAGGLA